MHPDMFGVCIASLSAMSMAMLKTYLYDLQAMLFSALCSSESVVAPYATARNIGEKPLSKEQFSKLRQDTLRPGTQAAASCHIDSEVTSADLGGQHLPHVPGCDLELTLKLSKTVFLGRYYQSSLDLSVYQFNALVELSIVVPFSLPISCCLRSVCAVTVCYKVRCPYSLLFATLKSQVSVDTSDRDRSASMCSLTCSCTLLIGCQQASLPPVAVCRFGSSVAAVRMARG